MTKRPNTYDDDDLQQVVEEIEGFFADEQATKRAAAELRQKEVKKAKARAKALNIPNDVLTATVAARKLEREAELKREKIVAGVKQDNLELFEGSYGQLSWLKPEGDAPQTTATQAAVERRRQAIQAKTDEELEEGAKVLDGMSKVIN